MVNLFSTYGCFPLHLDTHGVTIIYVVDIGKGWNDVKCWRQVQNHQTLQKSYEIIESNQIRLNKIYPIILSIIIDIFSLILFVLLSYYTCYLIKDKKMH